MENNKRRMPIGEGVMEDKKFNDIVYAYLQSVSYKIENMSEYRFLYKSQLNYTRIARELKMNLKTCKSKIKYLFENGYIVEAKKDDLTIYELPNLGQYYFLIPNETLKYLVDTCNENIIITYAYLGQLKNALDEKAYFTKGRLLILLGYGINAKIKGKKTIIPSTNQRDWDRINNILDMLENKLKLITTKEVEGYDGEKKVSKIIYEITTKIPLGKNE